MNNSRAQIFKAIRSEEIRPASSNEIQSRAKHLLDTLASLQPALSGDSSVENFHDRIQSGKITATSCRIDSIEGLPEAINNYMAANKLTNEIVIQPTPALTSLDWNDFKLQDHTETDQQLSVTLGHWGIAETGSIVVCSSTDCPILLNFLPIHHILVVHEENILAHLEDYANKAESQSDSDRVTCLITGASGTTDIEGVLVNGAHGPGHLHIVTIKSG